MINQNNSLKKKAALISMIVGLGMFAAKITAYLLTGSSAIFSDAAESVVHVLATGMALYSIILSAKPADKSHLYGHGNIEYFSAGVEGLLIVLAAMVIIYSSVSDLITGFRPEKLDIGTIIVGIAGAVNLWLGLYLIKKGKQTKSLALVADGKHVLTDSYTSIGVVIGLILVLITGFYIIDPLMAIFVALNILYTGYKLVRESIGGLMNETDEETLSGIVETLNSIRKISWIDIHHLKFWKSSNKIFVDFHLILPYYFTIQQSHLEENFIEESFNEKLGEAQVRIHMDYCSTNLCKYCDYIDCTVRLEDKSININWDQEKMIGEPVVVSGHIT